MTDSTPNQLSEHFFRHNYAKMVAVLVRYFGLTEVELAQDIAQDTLVEAMEKWSIHSIPDNPEGWMMAVAKKKTINFLKRNQLYQKKILPGLKTNSLFDTDKSIEEDSTLKMIFTCCHPDLPVESQIALALKTLCGFSVSEIASALLTTESTINKRLYRAKQQFRNQNIAYEIPSKSNLGERLDTVFSTLYLLFNQGYYASNKEQFIQMDLCFDAIRLLEEILNSFPNSHKAKALLSLMYLLVARFESRIDDKGAIVVLAEQNKNLWDRELIAKGIEYLHDSTKSKKASIYHLQAGIAAEHCLASSFEATNWKSIYKQYELLEKINPSPIIVFNKTVAKFYGIDKEEALIDLLSLKKEKILQKNTHFFTAVGVFYQNLKQKEKAIPYFETALNLSKSEKERLLICNSLDLG